MKKLYIIDVSVHGSALVYDEDGERAMDLAADCADDILDSTDVDTDVRAEIWSSDDVKGRFHYHVNESDLVYHDGDDDIRVRDLLSMLDERKCHQELEARQLHLFISKPFKITKA